MKSQMKEVIGLGKSESIHDSEWNEVGSEAVNQAN